MKRSDYKCECGHIFEIWMQNKLEDFPKDPICPECGSTETRMKFGNVNSDVCEGFCGNFKTGYEKNFTYHPSTYGRFKGVRVK